MKTIEIIIENYNTINFVYNTNNERRKTIYKENTTTTLTKYFSTNYERQITTDNTRELHYIFAGDGLCAVYEKNSSGTENIYYTHKDYLGSITEITDKDGVLLQRINYDAWGKRTLTYNNSVFSDFILDRGYTGHEHLDLFGLINMNGRLYDPMLGRMLSPDNYVQASDFTQTYNRYSYALNNPMKYTDPSGEFIPFLIIGAIIAGDQMGYYSYHAGLGYWKGFSTGAMISITMAGFSAGFGAVGAGIMSPYWSLAYSVGTQAIVGGLGAGMSSASMGGDFWEGAKYGAIAGGIGGGVSWGINQLSNYSARRSGGVSKEEILEKYGKGPVTDANIQKEMHPDFEYYPESKIERSLSYAKTKPKGGWGAAINSTDGVESEIIYSYRAAKTPWRFYLASGHELLHANDLYSGVFFRDYQSFYNAGFTRNQAKSMAGFSMEIRGYQYEMNVLQGPNCNWSPMDYNNSEYWQNQYWQKYNDKYYGSFSYMFD